MALVPVIALGSMLGWMGAHLNLDNPNATRNLIQSELEKETNNVVLNEFFSKQIEERLWKRQVE